MISRPDPISHLDASAEHLLALVGQRIADPDYISGNDQRLNELILAYEKLLKLKREFQEVLYPERSTEGLEPTARNTLGGETSMSTEELPNVLAQPVGRDTSRMYIASFPAGGVVPKHFKVALRRRFGDELEEKHRIAIDALKEKMAEVYLGLQIYATSPEEMKVKAHRSWEKLYDSLLSGGHGMSTLSKALKRWGII